MMNVVGLGKIFEYHEAALKQSNIPLNVGIDLNDDRLDKFQFITKSKKLEDLQAVVGDVLICTPPSVRMEIIRNCTSARCVYVEKPLALNAEVVKEIIEWSDKAKVPVKVLQSRRFFNNYRLIKEFLATQTIEYVNWFEGAPFGWESVGGFHVTEAGSVWNDLGPHVVDSLRFIIDPKLSLQPITTKIDLNDVDIRAKGICQDNEFELRVVLNRKRLNTNWISIGLRGGSTVLCKTGSENEVYLKMEERTIRILSSNNYINIKQPVSDVFFNMWSSVANGKTQTIPMASDNLATINLLNNLKL